MRRLVSCAVLVAACSHRGSTEPSGPTVGRAEDAAALPAFDSDAELAFDEPERAKIELGDAPTRGPATAPVTIVMYSDFQCPFCVQGHNTLSALEEEYEGQLRIAYKPYPLPIHSDAMIAALAARTAHAEGKFWPFHDRLFRKAELNAETLFRYAQEVGMDVERLRQDLSSLEFGPAVRRDMREARRLGVDSTPTFFINGRELSGAQPFEVFQSIIEQELALAKQWVSEGVEPASIYEHAIADGYTRLQYTKPRKSIDPDGVYPVPIGTSPTLGPDDAPITIVVFGDFQCPFCAKGKATVDRLLERYGDRIRIVYKHQPLSFHSFAFLAARASVAAQQQGKFWEFHDELYAQRADIDEQVILDVAKAAGLNMKTFAKQMNDLQLDKQIEEDQRLAASLGVNGTPAFFINGRPLSGAQPEIEFRLLITEELERVDAALARGIAAADLYETLTHEPLVE